ncbi:hypothetical protein L227DRAFT_614276 [Lentinus tigrinus ALCF2SS1-6]|uniref:Uncharacterized protein n=1 Tax=Lentinus tigrinus ALCF2SS1-6 TaxID=1328759 RepID=A0A5C2S057_9APHY|nr:hypothetical protein L227DRAFT_614276 [Lentinus tigrinus ALCF2SS1-6]
MSSTITANSSSATSSTTIYKKRCSDAMSGPRPDILNATPHSTTHMHKKRRLDNENHQDHSSAAPPECRTNSGPSSSKPSRRVHRLPSKGSSLTRQERHVHHPTSVLDPSAILVSEERIGPCVVVHRYMVRVPRPKATPDLTHAIQAPSKRPATTPQHRVGAKPAKSESSKKPASQRATTKTKFAGAARGQDVEREQAKATKPAPAPRAPGRADAKSQAKSAQEREPAMSLQELKHRMAAIGLPGWKCPLTRKELPSFRKNK